MVDADQKYRVERVTVERWGDLEHLFGRGGASNGCWCQYWLLGPEYHRRDRSLNRNALQAEISRGPADGLGPGLIAYANTGSPVGWARVSPRSELAWLQRRFAKALPPEPDVWSLSCFFVPTRWRGNGVMRALVDASIESAAQANVTLEGYPVDTSVPGATRNRFPGVLAAFSQAGFAEVGRLTRERPVVQWRPSR